MCIPYIKTMPMPCRPPPREVLGHEAGVARRLLGVPESSEDGVAAASGSEGSQGPSMSSTWGSRVLIMCVYIYTDINEYVNK